jgi:hypothetical protein
VWGGRSGRGRRGTGIYNEKTAGVGGEAPRVSGPRFRYDQDKRAFSDSAGPAGQWDAAGAWKGEVHKGHVVVHWYKATRGVSEGWGDENIGGKWAGSARSEMFV